MDGWDGVASAGLCGGCGCRVGVDMHVEDVCGVRMRTWVVDALPGCGWDDRRYHKTIRLRYNRKPPLHIQTYVHTYSYICLAHLLFCFLFL